MSENNISWFHCGRCGSLFRSSVGNAEERICTECGRNPVLGLEPSPAGPAVPKKQDETAPAAEPVKLPARGKHSVRKRKSSYFMVMLLAGWVLFVGLIIGGARMLWPQAQDERKVVVRKDVQPNKLTGEEAAEINKAAASCNAVVSGFLYAGTPEERNQFVWDPIRTASRMARFYELNPIVNINPTTLESAGGALLGLPGGHAIEMQWQAEDNRRIDAVFFEKDGEWRLDWDHFVRYSEYPWALFLAGSGPTEGEFRLLARERLAKERKNESTISIVLYAPRFGYVGENGYQSPEFLVKRDTRDGKLLDAAFEQRRKGQRPFGVKLKSNAPEDMICLRVKVRRVELDAGRRFELEKVIAPHWYSTDEPGVEITEATGTK